MNKKVSGAKSVVVKLESKGKNYLPFVEYLKDRYIKYIDVVIVGSLPYSTDACITDTDGLFVTLANKSGNSFFVHDETLSRYDLLQNLGLRRPIGQKLSLQNSYITVTDDAYVGKSVLLVFWYDLPEYSARNMTDAQLTDNFEVKIDSNYSNNLLPDNRTMVSKRFRKIALALPTYTPTFSPSVTDSDIKHLYITLQKGNYKIFDAIPLSELYEIGNIEILDFANIVFDFTYSYIWVGGKGTRINVAGKSVFFNAVYEDK